MEEDYIEIELDEDSIEYDMQCNIYASCPKCGEVHTEYDIEYEKIYEVECEKCGHKFSFSHCPY